MEKKKTVWYYVKNSLYYILIACLIFIIAVSVFVPQGLVKVAGFGWYRVVSNSMEPLIMVDDYIIVTKIDDVEALEEGDIIVFETFFYHNRAYSKDVVTHHFGGYDDEGHIRTYPHKYHGLEDKIYDTWKKSATEIYYLSTDDLIGVHVGTLHTSGIIDFVSFLFTNPIGIGVLVLNIGLFIGIYYMIKSSKNEKLETVVENESKELEDKSLPKEIDDNDLGDSTREGNE